MEQLGQKVTKPVQPLAMVKILVEIVEDLTNIEMTLKAVRGAIRDGSSLLYDLMPTYLSINMGQSGLATRFRLTDFHLVVKQGLEVAGQNFVVSLLRCETNPFVFMVILLDLVRGEEYVLELLEPDVFQICEGDQGLLEDAEPDQLA